MRNLHSNSIKPAEYLRQHWRIVVDHDATLEDLKRPSFWSNVAAMLRPGDKIEAVWEDSSRYVELMVLMAKRLEASVMVIIDTERTADNTTVIDQNVAEEYVVSFRGQRAKYSVMRGKEVVKSGFDTEDEARDWLKGHLQALAA